MVDTGYTPAMTDTWTPPADLWFVPAEPAAAQGITPFRPIGLRAPMEGIALILAVRADGRVFTTGYTDPGAPDGWLSFGLPD